MNLKEKRELWYSLITSAFANGGQLTSTESQMFKDKAAKMSEQELDEDIKNLQDSAEELARTI